MSTNLSSWMKRRRALFGAFALSCAAIVHSVSASGCSADTAIIHDCVYIDGGSTDGGTGGATALPPCN